MSPLPLRSLGWFPITEPEDVLDQKFEDTQIFLSKIYNSTIICYRLDWISSKLVRLSKFHYWIFWWVLKLWCEWWLIFFHELFTLQHIPKTLIYRNIWCLSIQNARLRSGSLYKHFGEPKVIVTYKAPSIGSAFRKLQMNGFYTKTEHRTKKYLNNLIEQDHIPVKRRNKFYQSLRTASITIKGMEALRGIYKKNRRNGTLFGFSVSTEVKVLMGIQA